jgi:hypothetical protein
MLYIVVERRLDASLPLESNYPAKNGGFRRSLCKILTLSPYFKFSAVDSMVKYLYNIKSFFLFLATNSFSLTRHSQLADLKGPAFLSSGRHVAPSSSHLTAAPAKALVGPAPGSFGPGRLNPRDARIFLWPCRNH